MERTNEELCLLIQSGDGQAKQDLCIKNQRLVKKVAVKYYGAYGNSLDREDLEQVGYLGLLTAAEKYDASSGAKFSTYAVKWIKHSILREIEEHGFSIRLPANVVENIGKCIKLDTTFMQQDIERDERLQLIAYTLDMTVAEVKKYLSMRKRYQLYVSLNTVVDEKSLTEVYELVEDKDTPRVEDVAEKNDLIERLHVVLAELNEQEQNIIKHRYGIDGFDELSYSELAVKHNLSEERIRQIEDKALRKMRYKLDT